MTRFLLFIFLSVFLFCEVALASPPPVPKRKTEALQVFKERLKKEEQEKNDLENKLKEVDSEVSDTRRDLVGLARSIQENEEELEGLKTRIDRLEEKKKEIELSLHQDRSSISDLIVALERIRRVPPEAILARPETPYKNAQSAMLMRNIIPVINRHAKKLRVNLETLENVTSELEEERSVSLGISEGLKTRKKKLSVLLDKRESLYRDMNKDFKAQEAQIQRISLQAQTLEDLVKRLDQEDKSAARRELIPPVEARSQSIVTYEKPRESRRFFSSDQVKKSQSSPQLPISGIIRVQYHEIDSVGAKSNGLTIEGRAGALVVAPLDGKIQFAGPFKRYGNLIIIEHSSGYHSLVAGLEKIDTVVGQTVVIGEPLGIMPNSSLAIRPKLYYELRRNGHPVNPATKFSDLG